MKHLLGAPLQIRLLPANLTSLKSLAKDKHSSLLRRFINYDSKKFKSTGPGLDEFQFNLQMSSETVFCFRERKLKRIRDKRVGWGRVASLN